LNPIQAFYQAELQPDLEPQLFTKATETATGS